MNRRTFGQALADVSEAVFAAAGADVAIRIRRLELALPLEVRIAPSDDPVLLADVPAWRWRTAFDLPPSSLRIVWAEQAQ